MRNGDLVVFKYFKNSYKNENYLGIIVSTQTDILIPTEWGYDKVDLVLVNWLDPETAEDLPYHTIGLNGERWYHKGQFYLVGE